MGRPMTAAAVPDDGREYDDPEPGEAGFDDELFERRMQVLSLRNGGMTYRAIASGLGISPDTARRDEIWARRYIGRDDIEAVINTQRSIILDGRRANYRAYLSGDKDATVAIFKGLDHEAKLLGLYAPTRIQTGPSHVDFAEQAAELIAQVSPNTLKELLRGTAIDPNVQRVDPEPVDVEVVDEVPPGDSGTAAPAEEPGPADGGSVGLSGHLPRDTYDNDGWSNI